MPTLHGFSYSNYYNIPKHALLYKGVVFSEDVVYPSAEGYNELSPVLKVPSLTTDSGQHLSESAVLCEYIEDAYPKKPLFPTDAFARNRNRQLMHMAELYLELPNRRLIPYSFSKQPAPEQLIAEVVAVVERGINSINALATFKPWLLGAEFTMADIYLYYVLTVAKMVDVFDWAGVSFVSVTQAFNTTSSMGRLTLKVLLSFAQFEREVTAERIRDKGYRIQT